MNFGARLEIHFHQQDEASVYLETNAVGDHRKYCELLIFCLLATRQMYNLSCGGDPGGTAHSLSSFLSQVPGDPTELLNMRVPDACKLVDYKGSEGRKRFIGVLKLSESALNFRLEAKGFGIFARGVGYYAATSVALLLEYLTRRRISDQNYLRGLARSANECGRAYLAGAITLTSQHDVACRVASHTFSHFIPIAGERTVSEILSCREAAEQGDSQAQVQFGLLFSEKGDHEQAVHWFSRAAEQGNPDGIRLLGDKHREGLGVPQDFKKAAELYLRGTKAGCPYCQANLAVCYLKGEGRPQDVRTGIALLELSAEKGVVHAMTTLGHIFKKGQGVSPDMSRATHWYLRAAQKGDPVAQNCLGSMYSEGEGVVQNHTEAAQWFQRAATQGYPPAQYNLAQAYFSGQGIQENFEEAVRWYYEAAKNGLVDAQLQLGLLLDAAGKIDDAKKWYALAAEQGSEGARRRLANLV
jgi:TPR repeat protein